MHPRFGIGYDIHRTAAGRRLVLGGVYIPAERGLLGHSDADVVLHALCDAMLGAAGLPDIGELYPDTDPAFKDADSRELLRDVLRRVAAAGLRPVSADVIVHAERPKLLAHKAAMRASLAELLCVGPGCIGLKARTNEGLGEIGRGEAIACWAAVVLAAPPS